jgi:hypothetical protein
MKTRTMLTIFFIKLLADTVFVLKMNYQIPPHPPLLKGGWGDYLIFIKSFVSQRLKRV